MKKEELKNKESLFPKGFFQKERPVIPFKESIKDIIPVEWVKKEHTEKKRLTS